MATTGEVAELRREQSVPIPNNKDSEYGAKPERRVRKFAPLRHRGAWINDSSERMFGFPQVATMFTEVSK